MYDWILDVYDWFPKLQRFSSAFFVITREDVEKYKVERLTNIGPSIHMWALMRKIQEVLMGTQQGRSYYSNRLACKIMV